MKLHLGCGNKHIDGFINIDIRYQPGVDIVDNIQFLRKIENNSIELIYSSHVLEHVSRWNIHSVISRWYDLLIPKGILRIAVPDFESICRYYLKTGKLNDVCGMLYGGQDYDENNHHWVWDFNLLANDLEKAGFKQIKRYDWKLTDHCMIDDYSQSYLPHMDKDNGQLMSLNIEAVK